MKSICAKVFPYLLLFVALSLTKRVEGEGPGEISSPGLPHWWNLFEDKLLRIMTKVGENQLQNDRIQTTVAKVSAAEAHLASLRTDIQTANQITTDKLNQIETEQMPNSLFEEKSGQIISEIASTKLQIEQLGVSMSNISTVLATQIEETKKANVLNKDFLLNVKGEVNCELGNIASILTPDPMNCSNYNPTSEFQRPFASWKKPEGGFCKVCMYGKEHLGKGDANGCFFPINGNEIFVEYGHYLLRQPTGVRHTFVPKNQTLAGVVDRENAEKILLQQNALNLASLGPEQRKGFAGTCNAGIPGNMPPGGGSYPVQGFLEESSLTRLIYTWGGKAYPCDDFSILTCVNIVN